MEAKKQSIEELKKEAENSQEQEAQAKVRLEEMQKNKEEKNSSHKEFFEKRDELSGQISLLDKECYRSARADGETGGEPGRTDFLHVGGV